MDLTDQRNPNDRLFVDATEQLRVRAFLDLPHRHVQKEASLGRPHKNELIFGFENRDVLHGNHDQLRSPPNKNSLQLALTPRFIKLRPLSLRRSSIKTSDAFREPF